MAKNTRKSGGGKKAVAQAAAKSPSQSAPAAESAAPAAPRVGPFKFLQQVRQEVSKVTWPSRKETMVTTVMVFIMVAFASLFFLLVDEVLGRLVRFILGLGS